MNEVIHIVSKEKDYWKKEEVEKDRMYEDTLELTGEKRQEILGFGGCFNELGWDALQKTKEEVREGFLKELYGAEAVPSIWDVSPSGPMISAWNGTAVMIRTATMS